MNNKFLNEKSHHKVKKVKMTVNTITPAPKTFAKVYVVSSELKSSADINRVTPPFMSSLLPAV